MKCIKGESRLNPSMTAQTGKDAQVYQRGITIESQRVDGEDCQDGSVSKGNHD